MILDVLSAEGKAAKRATSINLIEVRSRNGSESTHPMAGHTTFPTCVIPAQSKQSGFCPLSGRLRIGSSLQLGALASRQTSRRQQNMNEDPIRCSSAGPKFGQRAKVCLLRSCVCVSAQQYTATWDESRATSQPLGSDCRAFVV